MELRHAKPPGKVGKRRVRAVASTAMARATSSIMGMQVVVFMCPVCVSAVRPATRFLRMGKVRPLLRCSMASLTPGNPLAAPRKPGCMIRAFDFRPALRAAAKRKPISLLPARTSDAASAYARREPSWKSAPYMNLISRLLPASNILLDLPASSKKRAFEQAGLLFENNQGVARAKVFDSLFARERLGSTGLGQGVAIPHGRIKGLKDAVAAFVRVAEPVPFDAPDGQPVCRDDLPAGARAGVAGAPRPSVRAGTDSFGQGIPPDTARRAES